MGKIDLRMKINGKGWNVAVDPSTLLLDLLRDELGLTGWVKNEPDGSVLMEIQGKKEAIEKMIEWSKDGPEHSVVDNVEKEAIPLREFVRFEIRR